jgi:hypothetical protein
MISFKRTHNAVFGEARENYVGETGVHKGRAQTHHEKLLKPVQYTPADSHKIHGADGYGVAKTKNEALGVGGVD